MVDKEPWEDDEEEEVEEENEEKTYPIAELEEEETEPQKPTEEDRQKWLKEDEEDDTRERKKVLLEKLEKQFEESEAQDVQATEELKQIAKLRENLQSWNAILDNPNWELILRTYFSIVHAMPKMCSKTIVTISESKGQMKFTYEFFDSKGRAIITEFNEVEGEND